MIHVDCFNIAGMTPEVYARLYARASAARKAKADRYRRMDDRLRCIAADALLRRALGRDEFELIYNEYGKPALRDMPDFHFNIAHSGQWVVIAYGGCPVGVDVEKIQWSASREEVARRFFTPDEQNYVFSGVGEGRGEGFFRIWTAKESVLKYWGTGLGRSLDSFSVLQQKELFIQNLPLEAGYCLSLCAGQKEARVTLIGAEELPG